MSEKMKDGGPAFPTSIANTSGVEIETPFGVAVEGHSTTYFHGMTMRDYFAAKAMQALIASRHQDYEEGQYSEAVVAESAYFMADAMLAERNKRRGEG